MIKKLSFSDCRQAAFLHKDSLPNDFLASLGSDFLRVLYQIFSQMTSVYTYAWIEGKNIKGVLVGTTDTNSLFRTIFVSFCNKLVIPTLKSIIRNPTVIFRIIETFSYTKRSKSTTNTELLIICVAPEAQRKGIGSMLVRRFKEDLRKSGIDSFKVSTHFDSVNAKRFYQALGGKSVGQFKQYGTVWQTYLLSTTKKP